MEKAKYALKIVLKTLDDKNDDYCLAGRFNSAGQDTDHAIEQVSVTSRKLGFPANPKGDAEKATPTSDM